MANLFVALFLYFIGGLDAYYSINSFVDGETGFGVFMATVGLWSFVVGSLHLIKIYN